MPWNLSYSCEPLCGSLELNLGPLLDQQVLLIIKPSISPTPSHTKIKCGRSVLGHPKTATDSNKIHHEQDFLYYQS